MAELEKELTAYLKPGQRPLATRYAAQAIESILANAHGDERKRMAETLRSRLGRKRAKLFLNPEPPDDYEGD